MTVWMTGITQGAAGAGPPDWYGAYTFLHEFGAEDTANSFSDGVGVETWNDMGSRGLDASQTTSAWRPTYRSSVTAMNSKPALEFDGTNDTIQTAEDGTGATTYTIVLVVETTAWPTDCWACDGATNTYRAAIGVNSSDNWRIFAGFGAGSGDSSTAATSGCMILTAFWDGSTNELWKDGTSIYTNTKGNDDHRGITFGSIYSENGNYFSGHIAYGAVYDGNLTVQTGYSDWIADIKTHFGIT